MADKPKHLPESSSGAEIEAFLRRLAATPARRSAASRGRLLFAMDATASREPTWDQACQIQGEMFQQTAALGGLDIQLCYYRGFNEFYAGPWVSDAAALLGRMTAVRCRAGQTQIARVLEHALRETRQRKVNALVFVGDCVEEAEDRLGQLGGELGLLGVPGFFFHEGGDLRAEAVLRELARLSGGAYCHFDARSAQQLRELLGAVAVYAAGGQQALEDLGRRGGALVRQLTHQLRQG
jgi:hypothetical protein